MSSASTASSSGSSTTKKVEWYHLDRVAIAKRICLDPATVKLKTALNNNNNNYNNFNNNNNSNNISGSGKSGKSSNARGSSSNTIFNVGTVSLNTGVSHNNSNIINTSGSNRKATTSFDISRLLARPTTTSNTSTTASGSVDASVFSLHFGGSKANSTAGTGTKPVASFLTSSSAGGRQFAALQQKRRRKAARLAAAALVTGPDAQHLKKEDHIGGGKNAKKTCPEFMDEDVIIVDGTTSVEKGAGSCGSSSRSSSSGVSSDFEELEATGTSNMKVKKGSSGGDCQSSSSSECEDDDEEASQLPSFVGKTFENSSISNNNLINFGVASAAVTVEGGSASGIPKGVGVACKTIGVGGSTRIVNGKVVHNHSSVHRGDSGTSKAIHGSGSKVSKVESSSSTTSTPVVRSKHTNGQSSSLSSASSTTSGSTDNDRDTDNSFSEFPTDLDFIGMSDKGKRRTDRYDSSESSDSGVATLSPSTSDSPELISTCCDFTSDSLDVGNLISTSRSSSISTTSSYHHHPSSVKSSSSSSSSSSSLASSLGSSNRSTACFRENQGEPTGTAVSTTSIIEATLPSSSSSLSSTGSDPNLLATNPPVQVTLCLWKGCTCSKTETSYNILEHIQTTHVGPQMKTVGYVCLWEGCKVFNKRSSSLSWLERHVLSHSGNKPFKCIFPGCGLSFSSQTALERHVNSHIATNGTTNGTQGNSTVANRKIDASPGKSSRRKKIRFRKQRVNIGQRVDYFDKRIMEVIKHWLASSVDQFAVNAHDCTFTGEIMAKRVMTQCERQVLVRWHPRFILPDEWISESKFTKIKLVPLRRIPADKIRLLYPALFPPQRQEKATRKHKQRSNFSPSSARSTPRSTGSSSLTTLPPSPALSSPETSSIIDANESSLSLNFSRSTRRASLNFSASASSFSSTSSTATSSSLSSSSTPNSINQRRTSSSSTLMMMDTCSGTTKTEVKQEKNKCHKKYCGGSVCSCISALVGETNENDDFDCDDESANSLESSHWAAEILYEDLGIFPS